MVMKGNYTACIGLKSFSHKAVRFYVDLSMCEVSKVHISKHGTADLYCSEYTDVFYRQFTQYCAYDITCLNDLKSIILSL